jgi:hypothetical protein
MPDYLRHGIQRPMKLFIFSYVFLALTLVGCTKKYTDYELIRKVDFSKESYERPITVLQVFPSGNDELKSCFNQWLFFSNAEKEKNEAIPYIVRSLCPGKDYLLHAEMEEQWWTTIIFTRACVSVETKCAETRKQ